MWADDRSTRREKYDAATRKSPRTIIFQLRCLASVGFSIQSWGMLVFLNSICDSEGLEMDSFALYSCCCGRFFTLKMPFPVIGSVSLGIPTSVRLIFRGGSSSLLGSIDAEADSSVGVVYPWFLFRLSPKEARRLLVVSCSMISPQRVDARFSRWTTWSSTLSGEKIRLICRWMPVLKGWDVGVTGLSSSIASSVLFETGA